MKKRRTFAIIIATLLVSTFMVGCRKNETGKEAKEIVKEEENDMFGTFVVLHKEGIPDSDIIQYILYDPDTMVMWTFMDGYRCGGPSVIYNADGSLRLYEPK